jgi:hypothetical protein
MRRKASTASWQREANPDSHTACGLRITLRESERGLKGGPYDAG